MQLFLKRFLFISAAVIFSISVFGQGYKYNLEQIKRNSKRRIELIGEKLEEIEKQKEQAKKAQEIKEIFNRAEKLYEEGKLKEAKEFYERAYKMSSDDAMQSYIRRANKAIARKERQKQEKINNLYRQAKSAYSQRDIDKAKEVFRQVLEIDPGHRGAKVYLENKIPNLVEHIKKNF